MKLPQSTAIFIDLDNTILKGPFESVVFPTVFCEISRKSGLTTEEVRRLIVEENFRRQEDNKIPATAAMDWDDIVNKITRRLGVSLSVNVLQLVRSHTSPPYSFVLDKAQDVLCQLAAPHRKLIAATKGLRKYQLPILNSLNLTDFFTDILTPESNNALKQDRSFYGQWPEKTMLQISIGDHYKDDVVAPQQFGFFSVWKLPIMDEIKGFDPFERVREFKYDETQTTHPSAIVFSLQELTRVVTILEQNYF